MQEIVQIQEVEHRRLTQAQNQQWPVANQEQFFQPRQVFVHSIIDSFTLTVCPAENIGSVEDWSGFRPHKKTRS